MLLDTSMLTTLHYKVRIKGKVEQSREMSRAHLQHLSLVAIKKGDFGSPSTTGSNLRCIISPHVGFFTAKLMYS